MSDSAQIIMRIDPLSQADRQRIVDEISTWLLDSGVIVAFDASVPERAEFARTNWSPGPNWRAIVDEVPGAIFETLWNNGVDMTAEVDMQSAYGNFEEWKCPRCGLELESTDLIERWIESKREPVATCVSCGWAANLGDWPGDYPAALVGAPTIAFHNWHPLLATFVSDLVTRLGGGRCRYFWQRL